MAEIKQKTRYNYEGSVLLFNREVASKWKGSTMAVSEKQARNNLAFQAKRMLDIPARSPITLPGRLSAVVG